MKNFFIFYFTLVTYSVSHGQIPGEEFRGSWLTTVYNIDWPTSRNNPEAQQEEFKAIVEEAIATNMNAIFLQIRPNADAFYDSAYEPWSEWLTGERGKDPGYDPLEFAINEAHQAGIELHAWLNPYRFEITTGDYEGLPGDVSATNPEWILDVAGRTYFNPGIPEVTHYIKNIIGDVVGKYDLDGLVFDDYFYPSEIILEDQATFTTYGNGLSIRDFRRASVNNMIAEVHDTIKSIKPYLRFGVSPAGIYSTDPSAAASHNTTLPEGISGRDNYNAIYCDPLAWMEEGSIDYLSPQLYWQIGGGQDFKTLNDWWEAECNKHGVHFYPSLATYRLSISQPPSSSADGWQLNEIINQIQYLRGNTKDNGMVFFSNSDIEDVEMFSELLSLEVFNEISLWPEFGNSTLPSKPENLNLDRIDKETTASVIWANNESQRYYIKGFNENNETILKKISYNQHVRLPLDTITESFEIYTINKYGKINTDFSPLTTPNVDAPEIVLFNGEEIASEENLTWNFTKNASCYQISIAEDETFSSVFFNSDLMQDTFFLVENLSLEGNQTYFWKVRACNGKGCAESEVDEFFTGFPIATEITSPLEGEIHVPLTAEIRWETLAGATDYQVQIAKDSTFNPLIQDDIVDANALPFVSDPLEKWTAYYVRVRGLNDSGKGQWSNHSSFRTTTDIPNAPEFTSPENFAEILDESVILSWAKEDYATGYQLSIALDENFNQILLDSSFSQYKREYDFAFPEYGNYYARICSEYIGGCGELGDILYFSSVEVSSTTEQDLIELTIYPNPVGDQLFLKNLSHSLERGNYSLVIINAMGQKVMEKAIDTNQDTLHINTISLNKGVYFLRLVDENGNLKGLSRFIKL